MRRVLLSVPVACALLAGQALAGSSTPTAPGCHPGWQVVAHTEGKHVVRAHHLPVACVTETGYATSEPTLAVTPRGTVVVSPALSENNSVRSSDGGRTWSLTQPAVEQYTSLWNTVDPNLAVDRRTGRLYLVHATGPTRTTPVAVDESPLPNGVPTSLAAAAGFQVYASGDEGRTWTTADDQSAPMGDWEKVFTGPAPGGHGDVVYVCGNSPFEVSGPGRLCYRSLDEGATFAPAGYVFPSPAEPKACPALAANNGTVGPDGTVYQPVSCNDGSYVAVSTDEGASYTWHAVPGTSGTGTGITGQSFQVAADSTGTLYAGWQDGDHLLLSVSRDRAVHWSAPEDVAAPGTHGIALAQLAAGAAGQVGFAYYAAGRAGASELTPWVTQTGQALAARPVFLSGPLDDPRHPTYVNGGVTGPSPRADYVGACFDRQGRLWAAMVRQRGPAVGGKVATVGIVGHLA